MPMLPRTQWGPSVSHIQVEPWKFAFFWTPIVLAPTLLGHGEYPTLKPRNSLYTKGSLLSRRSELTKLHGYTDFL